VLIGFQISVNQPARHSPRRRRASMLFEFTAGTAVLRFNRGQDARVTEEHGRDARATFRKSTREGGITKNLKIFFHLLVFPPLGLLTRFKVLDVHLEPLHQRLKIFLDNELDVRVKKHHVASILMDLHLVPGQR
jgi:hypothetical protein